MWRSPEARAESAWERLSLASELWRWQPHPRQQEFFAASSQMRVAACGRRWGKTEALAVDIATLALAEVQAGRACRQLIVAPTDAQARVIGGEVLSLLWTALRGGGEEAERLLPNVRLGTSRTPCLQIVVYPSGVDPKVTRDGKPGHANPTPIARLFFRPAGVDGRSLRGLWAHRIVVDEAGYVPDEVITNVLLPMLTDVGGELTLASSPAGRRSVFYRLWARGEAAPADGLTITSFQCPSRDNPHLDQAFLDAMREELGEHTFAAEYEAQFVDEGGAVFREEDIEAALADDPRVTWEGGNLVSAPQPGRLYSVGVDWGRKLDFTVVCVLDATERPARLVGLWRWQGGSWELLAARVAEVATVFAPTRVLTDGNSIGDPMAENLQQAICACVVDGERIPQVERFLFGAESKMKLVDCLTLALSGRALTFPHHAALLAEVRGFEYGPVGTSGRARMAARGSGHDDIVMALALAWYAAPPGAPPPPGSLLMLGSQAGLARRDA